MTLSDIVDWLYKVFKDCFTERDGVSWCWVRFTASGVILVATYKLLWTQGISLIDYSAACTGAMASVGFKNASERDK